MKNYVKVAAILVAVLTIYSIVIYAIAGNKNSNENKEKEKNQEHQKYEENILDKEDNKNESENLIGDYNIILSPNTIISYINGSWKENKNFKYQDKKFELYINNDNYGFKNLTYSDSWKFFDENRNFLDVEDKFLAINTNLEYINYNVNNAEINDSDKITISTFLEEKGITFEYEQLNITKFIVDVNNDGIRDDMFFISNAFVENESNFNKSFAFGFIKYYDKLEEFYNVNDKLEEVYKIGNPTLQNILKINDKIYYIISVEYFSDKGTEHIIYKLENNILKKELKTSINNN